VRLLAEAIGWAERRAAWPSYSRAGKRELSGANEPDVVMSTLRTLLMVNGETVPALNKDVQGERSACGSTIGVGLRRDLALFSREVLCIVRTEIRPEKRCSTYPEN
jgi:hypothetical protein